MTRERDHNDGRGGSYTSKRRPVQLIYAEQFASKPEALKREQQIKGWTRKKKEALVRGDLSALFTQQRLQPSFTWRDWLKRG